MLQNVPFQGDNSIQLSKVRAEGPGPSEKMFVQLIVIRKYITKMFGSLRAPSSL